MTLILGLDAGGSKTRALLADLDGTVVAALDAPGLDPNGGDDWQGRLAQILAWARKGRTLSAAALGLSCHGETEATSALQRVAAAQGLGDIPHLVLNDVEIAFDGAFAGGPGILLLSGTGSMVWSGNGQKSLRVGGWGELFGDEGSAYWIGREALGRVSRSLDGRCPGAETLTQAILKATGTDAAGLLGWAFGQKERRAAFAALARTVCATAEAGDAEAQAILARAGRNLADHVRAARIQLAAPDLSWAPAGGVFACKAMVAAVAEHVGPAVPPCLSPAAGAVLRAATLAGLTPGVAFIARLANGQHMTSLEEKD